MANPVSSGMGDCCPGLAPSHEAAGPPGSVGGRNPATRTYRLPEIRQTAGEKRI